MGMSEIIVVGWVGIAVAFVLLILVSAWVTMDIEE